MIARIDATEELRTAERMEPLQFSWQERHALPVAVIRIAPDRKRIRRGEGPAQHRSVIELIVQSLQYRAGDWVTFEDFPKTRRPPPVHLVVAVMIGPHAISRGLQDPAPQNPEAKPHERSEEHTSELQSRSDLVCRLLLEKKKQVSNAQCAAHLNCHVIGQNIYHVYQPAQRNQAARSITAALATTERRIGASTTLPARKTH